MNFSDIFMIILSKIEKEVSLLPENAYDKFRRWFYNYDFERWDKEIDKGGKSGRLDFLAVEALEEKKTANLIIHS